jgi:hypothetical protein
LPFADHLVDISLSIALAGGLPDSYADERTLSTDLSEQVAALAGAVKTSKLTARLEVKTSAAAANAFAALPNIQCFSSIFSRKMFRKIVFISVELFSKSCSLRQIDQHAPYWLLIEADSLISKKERKRTGSSPTVNRD